jgi:nicotinamide phosphoribosyltransferase
MAAFSNPEQAALAAIYKQGRKPFVRPETSWILKADSYKHSHKPQYPKGIIKMRAYIEPRSSRIHGVDWVQFFGLLAGIKEHLLKPITHADVDYAKERVRLHGNGALFFAEVDFRKVVDKYEGYPPIRIYALKEGTNAQIGIPQVVIECDDPDLFWMVSFFETILLRAVWYGSTVSTISKACKNLIMEYLEKTSDDPAGQIGFKLHDFGARGVSSDESAQLGGMAHLLNFLGTDTMTCLEAAKDYYGCLMAGFSINASEHSTMTSWTKVREFAAYSNMIKQFGKPGAMFACVSDSYDLLKAVAEGWGTELKAELLASGATLVVRPDSGDPISNVLKVLEILGEKFGYTVNKKGYKVLNNVRMIQGDGVELDSIRSILVAMELNQWSVDNIAFGMGGALLQKLDRDTFGYAQKTCAGFNEATGEWFEIFKEAPGKMSKKGLVTTVLGTTKKFMHGAIADVPSLVATTDGEVGDRTPMLELTYDCGYLIRDETYDEIRVTSANGISYLAIGAAA